MDDFRKLESLTWPELALLASCRLLSITKHSKAFIEEQKNLVKSMGMSKAASDLCMQALDSIETEGAK